MPSTPRLPHSSITSKAVASPLRVKRKSIPCKGTIYLFYFSLAYWILFTARRKVNQEVIEILD